jgi:prepilin-type N-terminal cleavage/methylation domain-containing protein
MSFCRRAPYFAAFTLIELLVVVAVVAILASLLFPTLSHAKSKAQGTQCLNNLKQFALAWTMYNGESNGRVAPNDCCDLPGSTPHVNTWVRGWIYLGDNSTDDTNTLFLTQSLLAPYLNQNVQIWRCPSDKSTSRQGGRDLPRVRTVSMNCWLNAQEPNIWATGGRMIKQVSDMIEPSPSQTFVFTDERSDSINDAYFDVVMDRRDLIARLGDWPGSYHNGAGTFSFADSRAEFHKWQDPRTTPPLQTNHWDLGNKYGAAAFPNSPDVEWLQTHATSPK